MILKLNLLKSDLLFLTNSIKFDIDMFVFLYTLE